jgi:hypothetical protein
MIEANLKQQTKQRGIMTRMFRVIFCQCNGHGGEPGCKWHRNQVARAMTVPLSRPAALPDPDPGLGTSSREVDSGAAVTQSTVNLGFRLGGTVRWSQSSLPPYFPLSLSLALSLALSL